MSKQLMDISVRCRGVKKRCRKPDTHIFKVVIGLDASKPLDLNEYAIQAKDVLAKEMKEVSRAEVYSTHYELLDDGDFTTKRLNLFDPRNKSINLEL